MEELKKTLKKRFWMHFLFERDPSQTYFPFLSRRSCHRLPVHVQPVQVGRQALHRHQLQERAHQGRRGRRLLHQLLRQRKGGSGGWFPIKKVAGSSPGWPSHSEDLVLANTLNKMIWRSVAVGGHEPLSDSSPYSFNWITLYRFSYSVLFLDNCF